MLAVMVEVVLTVVNDANNIRTIFNGVLQDGQVRLDLSLIKTCTYWWKEHLTLHIPHNAIPAMPCS